MANRRYVPQFDGVRAVAISAVVAYHLGYLKGGWVGVDIFFVLSGYLITSLLLAVDQPPGKLVAFWGRRAKRLLPAVLVLLAALSVYAWVGGPGLVPAQLRSPALATLFYVANWQQIAAGHSYFAQFQAVSPLQHTWSLAIEEQYYVLWPLLILMLAAITVPLRGRRTASRVLLVVTVTLAVASAVWMGLAAHWLGPNRAYLGTDTRAWELLMGGAAAMIWPLGRSSPSGRGRLWSTLGVLGLAGVAVGAARAGGPPWWIWNGGLVAIAMCALLVIVGAMRAPDGVVGRVFALGPIRWLGVISYSLYLWHWPVIVLMTHDSTGWSGWPLLAARLATMLALSCASFYLIENPLRRADWGVLRRRFHVPGVGFAALGVAVTALCILAGTIGPPPARTAQVAVRSAGAATAPPVHVALQDTSQPYRMWIFGDSVMFDSSLGVIAALQSTGDVEVTQNSAFPGWGLTIDHAWLTGVQETLAHNSIQIAMGTWSWDDPEAEDDPTAYRALLTSYVTALLAPPDGVKLVVLLQFPQAGPIDTITDPAARQVAWVRQTKAQDAWDDVARQVVAEFPGRALYLTTDQLFAPRGRFLAWMRTPTRTWVRARKLDNTHMCPYGAAQFGALVTEELTPILHLGPMKAGWEFASWTKDPRYNDPAGACPDDQPPAHYRGLKVPQ